MTTTPPAGMRRCEDPAAARTWCEEAHAAGLRLGFVPTMGALHEGHLSLVRRSRAETDATVVSVFVNPLQFDDPADLARYPRDFAGDARHLAAAGAAMVFTGELAQFFPEVDLARGSVPAVDPGPGERGLEGAFRKGHFAGVATIVARLLEIVRPGAAYFGAKDFQQTLVVRHVARRLGPGAPAIVVCPTSREPDGLARSSRNVRLSAEGRARAAALPRALRAARERWAAGERHVGAVEAGLRAELEAAGLEVEYAAVRDPERWDEPPSPAASGLRALVAARVDGVRLIDNLALDGSEP